MMVALTALLMWSGGPAAGDRLVVTTGEEMAEAAAAPLATFVVDRTDDDAGATACTAMSNDCSLRGAIIKANTTPGMDTIVLQPGATYTLSLDATAGGEDSAAEDDLDIANAATAGTLTIVGNGATITRSGGCTLNALDAAGEFRIFEVLSGGDLTLQNVTVTNGCARGGGLSSNGGGIFNRGTVTLINSTISENAAFGQSGGISSTGTVTLTNSTLSGNSTKVHGGGIFNEGTVTLTNSTISGNSADRNGGGIFNRGGGTATITNSTISMNSAGFDGGGIFNGGGGTATITNSTISENTTVLSGGGIANDGMATIQSSTISMNRAGEDGGGIRNFSGTVRITNSTISGNSADRNGGGIFNHSGTAEITASTISDNSADDDGNFEGDGGGIHNGGTGTVRITASTISENSATFGGGIYNGKTVTIQSSTISENSAGFDGGGIHNAPETVATLTNSTISGNSADRDGGGISVFAFGTLNASFVTIANNSAGASGEGGGIFVLVGTVNIKNSIVGNNTASTGLNCSGGVTASGANLATDGSCGMGFATVPSTGLGGLNLGLLADNGGPTQTHALLSGSVAVDAVTDCTDLGSNLVSQDQRGVMRPIDGDGDGTPRCDVGAYEASVCTTDTMAPQITCPSNITVGTNVGCTYVGSIGTATATDNCDLSVTISNNAPAAFPLGVTTVTWKATDDFGNMSTCTQTVTVVDDDAPQITCPSNQTVQAGANCQATVSVGTATATDNCTASGSITITGTRSDAQPLTAPYPGPSGVGSQVTTITWKATDAAGNMATCIQTITVTNAAPTANAGPDQTVDGGALVTLNGSGSSDPNLGQTLTFQWTQTGGPSVSLIGANTATPSFVAPCPTTSVVLTFQLEVTDSCGAMNTDSVAVTVTNAAPTANAGPDQTVDEGAMVTLNGSGSSDPNPGQTLTFQWTQTGGPAVVINNANTATATFTAPEVGTLECVVLTFQVKVTDPCGAMATDTVVVRVQDTLVLQDDADPTKCVVIRRDCGPTANGTYCMKVGGMTLTGPLTVSLTGNVVNAQSTAADPNVAQGSIDLGRCRGNFRLTISRTNPTVTHTIVSNVNACNDVCTCP